jgi:hypothetical protein
MTRFRLVMIPLALVAAAGPAGAQRWGGSPASAGRHDSPVETKPATGGSWNGTASRWGGSPVRSEAEPRVRTVYVIPPDAYIPVAIAAPAPVTVTYVIDTVYTAAFPSPVDMKVVTSSRPEPQLTAMDVYRQQRFKQP